MHYTLKYLYCIIFIAVRGPEPLRCFSAVAGAYRQTALDVIYCAAYQRQHQQKYGDVGARLNTHGSTPNQPEKATR